MSPVVSRIPWESENKRASEMEVVLFFEKMNKTDVAIAAGNCFRIGEFHFTKFFGV